MINHLMKNIQKITDFFGKFASNFIIILIILVSTSVLLRYVFAIGFTWLQDLYIWIHALFILLGIAYTFNKDGHVRIDILYRKFNNKKKRIVNLFGSIVFGIPFCLIIIFKGYEFFLRSFTLNENSKESGGLPNLFILKFFIFFMGLLLFGELLNRILSFFKKND